MPGKAGGTVEVSPLLKACPCRSTPGRARAPPRAGSAGRYRDRDPFFYPFIIFFFNRLRAEYENHQPKHLKKRSRMFFLFCFFPKSVCAFA